MEKINHLLRKIAFTLTLIFLTTSFVYANTIKIEFPLGSEFKPNEKITLKVSLYDSQNILIDDSVDLTFEDARRLKTIEKTISSRQISEIDLGEGVPGGEWKLTAKYKETQISEIFTISSEELIKFEITDNVLKVTNVGNTKYSKTIQIVIGDSIGVKEPVLEIGESVTYRLIAPEGEYRIRISDGQTTFTKNNVYLTGEVIGVLDDRIKNPNPLTSVSFSAEENKKASFLKSNKLAYVFLIIIVSAAILLTIERRYNKRLKRI